MKRPDTPENPDPFARLPKPARVAIKFWLAGMETLPPYVIAGVLIILASRGVDLTFPDVPPFVSIIPAVFIGGLGGYLAALASRAHQWQTLAVDSIKRQAGMLHHIEALERQLEHAHAVINENAPPGEERPN